MNQFFKDLAAAMADRQEAVLNIKKIGDDLVVMVTPDIKHKGTVLHLTGSPDDMDQHFLDEFSKPSATKTEFSAQTVSEDEEEEPKAATSANSKKKTAATAKPAKKVAPKKEAPKEKDEIAKLKEKRQQQRAVKEATGQLAIPAVEEEPDNGPSPEELQAEKERLEREEAGRAEKEKKEEFSKLVDIGKECMDAKNFADAVTNYEKALELFPDSEGVKATLEIAREKKKAWDLINS